MKPCDIPLDGPSALHSALSEDGGLTQHIEQCHPEAATETAVPPSYEQVAAHIAWHAAEIRECGEGCEFDPARVRPLTREEALSAVAFARMPEPRIVYATLLAYATLGANIAAKDAECERLDADYRVMHDSLTGEISRQSDIIRSVSKIVCHVGGSATLWQTVAALEAKLREAEDDNRQLRARLIDLGSVAPLQSAQEEK